MPQNQLNAYSTQHILSASPARLVYMLYDRAIFWLNDAIAAIAVNEIERRWRACCKARDILDHFITTLNMEEGGEIAANLDKILTCCLYRLPDVDIKNDPKAAADVIRLLEPLRDSWRQLAIQLEQEQTAPPTVNPNAAASAPAGLVSGKVGYSQPAVCPNPSGINHAQPAQAASPGLMISA